MNLLQYVTCPSSFILGEPRNYGLTMDEKEEMAKKEMADREAKSAIERAVEAKRNLDETIKRKKNIEVNIKFFLLKLDSIFRFTSKFAIFLIVLKTDLI